MRERNGDEGVVERRALTEARTCELLPRAGGVTEGHTGLSPITRAVKKVVGPRGSG